MNPEELKDFMFGHGFKVFNEDYEHTLFAAMQQPHTKRDTVVGLLTLAGYDVFEPKGFTNPRYIFVNHPPNP